MLGLDMIPTLMIFTFCMALANASWWHPHPHMAWNYVIAEHNIKTDIHGNMFVVDLFDVPKNIIDELHRNGIKVICHFSAGTKEDWRTDAGQFPSDGLGASNKNWTDETWVDIRNIQVRRIMRERIEHANRRHCDGVDPENVNGWEQNRAGLHLTPNDQLDYNRYLAHVAHANGLAVGLKDDVSQLSHLVVDFDFAINESCLENHTCDLYEPFFRAGKPVFHVQYVNSIREGHQRKEEICSNRPPNMNTLIKVKMDNWKLAC